MSIPQLTPGALTGLRVVEMGQNMGLPLKPEDVAVVSLENGGYEVRVHYDVTVDLLFFQHDEHFDFISRTGASALSSESGS